jgi:hypothetical protein
MKLDLTDDEGAPLLRELNTIIEKRPISAVAANKDAVWNTCQASRRPGSTATRVTAPHRPAAAIDHANGSEPHGHYLAVGDRFHSLTEMTFDPAFRGGAGAALTPGEAFWRRCV